MYIIYIYIYIYTFLANGAMDLIETRIAAESCKGRQTFIRREYKKRITHCYETVSMYADGRGHCILHNENCDTESEGAMDIITFGAPCTPYTRQGSQFSASATKHPAFASLWEDIPRLFILKSPHGGILEESDAFGEDSGDGVTWARKFIILLEEHKFYAAQITICGSIINQFPRRRSTCAY
jgi:hypothetical protein